MHASLHFDDEAFYIQKSESFRFKRMENSAKAFVVYTLLHYSHSTLHNSAAAFF